ncbi:hypothetical protein HD554DRAFT_2170850 [Boletus coccyginus]|nr:hypothetical protein HD554DRAFT_2170850 [Boletus coccyginus]
MQSTGKDGSSRIEIKNQHGMNAVFFAEDGKQVFSGGDEGMLRRWRVDDGHEIGEPIRAEGAEICAAALSPDGKWLLCGLRLVDGSGGKAWVRVWDAQTHEKVLDIPGHTNTVWSVDISRDSTKFATGACDGLAFIWNMTTGERLLGPLQHDGWVVAVRFSPNGDRIAIATAENPDAKSIHIYNTDNGQQLWDIPFSVQTFLSSSLTWSHDGRQLFGASYGEAKCFDTATGTLLSKWSIHANGYPTSITLTRNQKFVVVSVYSSLSFWDTSTHEQIGTVIGHESTIWSTALSPNDDCVATGEQNGKVILRSLRDVLPVSYLTVNLPFMYISDAAFKLWTQGDLTRVEELFADDIIHPSNPSHHARALAHRALVRSRLKRCDMAIDDAKKSIEVQRSIIGYIAHAIAHVGNGEYESATRVFDLVFSEGIPSENRLLLLLKAIVLFECGRHEDAVLRVDDLIDIVKDKSPYIAVRARMLLLLGGISIRGGDNERAIELFKRAQEAIPFGRDPYLAVISLLFGWDFDRLAITIQLQLSKAMYATGHSEVAESLFTIVETLDERLLTDDVTTDWDPDLIQKYRTTLESNGDIAVRSKNFKGAIVQYSTALSLNPSNPEVLLVKRSNARAMLGMWEDALKDADGAIKADPSNPRGYERRHAALHALQRYDEATDAFNRMFSLVEGSVDEDIRQLRKKYISPTRSKTIINNVIRGVMNVCPLALIDVKSGRLCDGPERVHAFKSESQFKELVSSITEELDNGRIQRVVEEYFQYVTLSHVWEGKEPSFQDVNLAKSVWDLDSSPLHEKLRKFCEVVRSDGYRWAWSDTCCIDKMISTVLNQSLKMMYKWYEASAATFVLLADVDSPSALGDLTNSIWMTRAWTAQELLAAKVVRFYTRDWQPYLGDTRANHKESPEIMQELANAIGVARETIIAFNPDNLSVRAKLRLASGRNATVEEDVAYSLIGIFKSDIRPDYGERDAALGHLLEEIVARSGEVTVLSWTGKSSPYNSCLPATLAVYSQPPYASPAIEDAEMDLRVAALRNSLSQTDVVPIYDKVTRLPPARFATRRLHLPCIIFTVRRLGVQDFGSGLENCYRARVSGIGNVEFQTCDRLSLTDPHKLIFVHPWIHTLCDPLDRFTWESSADDDEYDTAPESASEAGSAPTPPLYTPPAATMDGYTRALGLIVRLQQPFHALLLQQQPNGEFKRIAAEHEIVIPGIDRGINFARDMRIEVVEIL